MLRQAEKEHNAREAEKKRRALEKQLVENAEVLKRKAELTEKQRQEDKDMMDAVRRPSLPLPACGSLRVTCRV